MAPKINSSKLLPSSSLIKKGSAIIIADKKEILSTLKTIRISSGEKKDTGEVSGESKNDELNEIHKKLLTIQKLLGSELKSLQSKTEETRKEKEKKEFEEGEKKLEVPKVKGLKLPSLRVPGVSFLGGLIERIKRFIFFTALAWLFPKIIEFLPKLKWIANLIGGVYKFAEGLFGKLFDGFMSLVKFGGDLKDKTIGFIAQLKGGNYQKEFEKLENLFNTFANASIVAGVLGLDIGIAALKEWNRSRKPPKPTDGKPPKPTDGKPPKPSVTTGKGGKPRRLPIGRRAPVTTGKGGKPRRLPIGRRAPVTTGKGGKPPSWWDKIFKGPFAKLKGPLSKFAGAVVPGVGAVVGAADAAARFKSGDKLGGTLASASASLDALAAGSAILAITGIGAAVPAAFGTISMGIDVFLLIRDILKYFNIPIFSKGGRIVNDEEKDTEVTRGGKYVNRPARRTIKAAVIKKPPKVAPVDSSPGKDVGGELKIQRIFPSPESSVIGKGKVKKGAKKTLIKKAIGSPDASSPTTEDRPNPFNVLTSTAKTLKEIPLIGGIMGSGVDLAMGQKIESKKIIKPFSSAIKYLVDTLTVEGINFNITSLFNDMKAFNEGGVVPPSRTLKRDLFDVEGLLDKVLGPIIQQKVNEAIQNIQNELKKKGELLGSEGGGGGEGEGDNLDVGDGVTVTGGTSDFWTLVAVASQEDGDPQGQADVAQSIYNRVASKLNFGQKENTIRGHILAHGQYEPTWKNGGTKNIPTPEWHQIKDAESAARATGGDISRIHATAAALRNKKYQQEAAKFVGGRTDFMGGGNQPGPGDIRRKENAPNNFFGWFVGGASIAYGKTNPGPARVPQLGNIVVMGGRKGEDLDVMDDRSVRRGDTKKAVQRLKKEFPKINQSGRVKTPGQIYASGLGFWLKKNFPTPGEPGRKGTGDYGDPSGAVRGGMEHPDHGGVVASHRGKGHYQGIALDLGANGGAKGSDQDKMWPYIRRFLKIYGLDNKDTLPQVLHAPGEDYKPRHGGGPDSGHADHLHVEFGGGSYEKGGFTKKSKHIAMLAEKGPEFVIDADSTASIEKKFPGLLYSINKAKGYGAVKALLNYFKRSRSKAEPIRKQKIYPVQERSLDRIDYSTVFPSNPIADKKPNVPDLRSFASYESYAPAGENKGTEIFIIEKRIPVPVPIKQNSGNSDPIMFPVPVQVEVNNMDSFTKGRGY